MSVRPILVFCSICLNPIKTQFCWLPTAFSKWNSFSCKGSPRFRGKSICSYLTCCQPMPLGLVTSLGTEPPAHCHLLGALQPATVLSISALPNQKWQFLDVNALKWHLFSVTRHQNVLCSTGHTGISSKSQWSLQMHQWFTSRQKRNLLIMYLSVPIGN